MAGFNMARVGFSLSGATNGTVAMEATDTFPCVEPQGVLLAKYEEYISCERRFSTFSDWPKFLIPSGQDLSLAGFVYGGKGDLVFCFCCGIKVKDWEPSDNAWAEHWKHSPNCNYLMMTRLKNSDTLRHFRLNRNLFCKNPTFGSKGIDVVDKTD